MFRGKTCLLTPVTGKVCVTFRDGKRPRGSRSEHTHSQRTAWRSQWKSLTRSEFLWAKFSYPKVSSSTTGIRTPRTPQAMAKDWNYIEIFGRSPKINPSDSGVAKERPWKRLISLSDHWFIWIHQFGVGDFNQLKSMSQVGIISVPK